MSDTSNLSTPGVQDLVGRRILITAQRRASDFVTAFERRGAAVVHAPSTSALPAPDDTHLARLTASLIATPPDIAVVTTGVGLRGWLESATASGHLTELLASLRGARIVARGAKAKGAIVAAGLDPEWVAQSETDAEVMEHVLAHDIRSLRIAVQHHGSGDDGMDDAFRLAGATVVPVVIYRAGPPPDPQQLARAVREVAERDFDAVVFTSKPGVLNFLSAAAECDMLDEVLQALRSEVIAATVGPVTAQPLIDRGIEPLQPTRPRMGALIRSLTTALSRPQMP